MTATCNKCGASYPDACCGSGSYPYRYTQCPYCYQIVPNPTWSRLSIIDGDGEALHTVCPECHETVFWKNWVFTRLDSGLGEYSCPLCQKIWVTG